MYSIDPGRVDLAREFKARPFGEHSPDLQYLLHLMRTRYTDEFPMLVMTRPYEQWTLAWKSIGTIEAPRPTNVTFDSIEAAEWHVFRLRWQALSGQECPIE